MEVVLRYHNSVRPTLERIRDGLEGDVRERARRYEQLLEAIREQLTGFDGLPPEAVPSASRSLATYWLAFSDELLIQYTLRDTPPAPRGWWDVSRRLARWRRGVFRVVTVIALVPLPATPASEPPRD